MPGAGGRGPPGGDDEGGLPRVPGTLRVAPARREPHALHGQPPYIYVYIDIYV